MPARHEVVCALPRRAQPEWHRLRLFGDGRHAGAFHAGAEQEGGW
ncbi:MAG TPA: hypothetical protein VGH67_21005 [Solirubrobacteraceae bacterium]